MDNYGQLSIDSATLHMLDRLMGLMRWDWFSIRLVLDKGEACVSV
jgi:hypothetical protein